MELFERRDAEGAVIERAFLPSDQPERDAQVREQAAAAVNGWAEASDGASKPKPRAPRTKKSEEG